MSAVTRLKLPEHPSLDHLKTQAYDLQREARAQGKELALADAYHELAKRYGFASWPRLKQQVEFLNDHELQTVIQAIKQGDAAEVRRLLAAHAGLLQRRSPNGYCLLHHACRQPVAVLGAILDAGLAIDTALPTGETVLHFSATYPETERVALLLERGARPDLEGGPDERYGGTPLVHALFYGLRENADLLAQRAMTPLNLRVAAGLGRLELMESLVRPDGTLAPEAGQHRAWYRAHNGFPSWRPSDNREEILGEALMYAAMNGRLEAVTWLLDHDVPVDARPYRNATAMHWAAFRGRREAVELLLNRGADVDIQDDEYHGFPWGWAGHMGQQELERYLLSKSKTLDIFNACNFGAGVERIRQMLDRDPSLVHARQVDPPSCGRHKHGTALHEAVDWYKRDIMLLLLERGAEVNARTEAGLTPLAIALERKNEEGAEILRSRGGTIYNEVLSEAGAAPSIRNGEVKAPIEIALERSHVPVEELSITSTGKYAHLLADLEVNPSDEGEGFIDWLVANYGIQQASIRPYVLSKRLVKERLEESFRIAVTGNPDREAANTLNSDCLSIHTLATVKAALPKVGAMAEAAVIARDLRSYYLRHYSGRCFRNTGESNFDSSKPEVAYVYIAFFDKARQPPRDGV